ncbi:MAG TPA: hypothetical protein VKF38_01370, partial [Anaerolineaceae bacterium]|nr:hypothetical protein [Anaerolineaceae bacterium]
MSENDSNISNEVKEILRLSFNAGENYKRSHDFKYLNEEINYLRQIIRDYYCETPDESHSTLLMATGELLLEEYNNSRSNNNITEAKNYFERAAKETKDLKQLSAIRSRLATTLTLLASFDNDDNLLDESIQLHLQAISQKEQDPIELISESSAYTLAIVNKFKIGHENKYIKEALKVIGDILVLIKKVPPSQINDIFNRITILPSVLDEFYKQTSNPEFLNAAIDFRNIILSSKELHPLSRLQQLDLQANALFERYNFNNDINDLETALKLLEELLILGENDPALQESSLRKISHGLVLRYGKFGGLDDLQKAIEYQRKYAELTSKGNTHDFLSVMADFATMFGLLSSETDNPIQIEAAIKMQEDLIHDPKLPSEILPMCLHNLANVYGIKFLATKNRNDLESSINYRRQSMSNNAINDNKYNESLISLASSLFDLYLID